MAGPLSLSLRGRSLSGGLSGHKHQAISPGLFILTLSHADATFCYIKCMLFIVLVNKRRFIMTTVADKVLDEALALPADARIGLVEKLLTSLNLPIQPEIEQLWAEEAEQRFSQIKYGETELVPGDRVFNEIREKYPKK
jgi:hypothetical protein